MSDPSESRVGMMRCTRTGCTTGMLGPSGQEPYRLICGQCGQNYFVKLTVEPVEPKPTQHLLPPVSRAE
jgi:hypothetical protein